MIFKNRDVLSFGAMALLFIAVGTMQSWNLSLAILNLGLISAIMALGVNIQWGYAGLLNVGVMGFAALGGLAAILVSAPPVQEAWVAGGSGIIYTLMIVAATIVAIVFAYRKLSGTRRRLAITAIGVIGYFLARMFFAPATGAIEQVTLPHQAIWAALACRLYSHGWLAASLPQVRRGLLAKSPWGFVQTIWLLPLWASQRSLLPS